MYTLAIDASTKATGIAVFDNNQLIKYDCINCYDNNTLDRINYMADNIEKIYLEYSP